MQGARVESLVSEDRKCQGATKPTYRNYWSARTLEPALGNKRSHHKRNPCTASRESAWQPRPSRAKKKTKNQPSAAPSCHDFVLSWLPQALPLGVLTAADPSHLLGPGGFAFASLFLSSALWGVGYWQARWRPYSVPDAASSTFNAFILLPGLWDRCYY